MVISFSTGVLLFKWIQSFQHSQDHLSVSQHCSFHPSPSCLCFSRPPTILLQGLRCLNQVSILLMQSLFILFFQCSYPVIFHEDAHEASSLPFFILFFSGGFNSSLQCWSHSFPRFKCFLMSVHLLIIHLLLFMLSGVLKISQKIRISIPNPFKLSRGCYLFWAI